MKTVRNYKGLLFAALITLSACKKVSNGYLSDQIHYPYYPILVQRGVIKETDPINNDGSSAPVEYELLDIRDAVTHKHADSIYANHDRYVFTARFDPTVDTTVALLNTKRKMVSAPCFEFNKHTGAFDFFGTTVFSSLGSYEYDVKATNEAGTRIFKNISAFTLFDGDPYEIETGGGAWFLDGTTTSGDIGQPEVVVKRVSTDGDRVIMKIVDKNGTPFNPKNKEILKRGDRSDFETYARFHPLIITDTSMICDFELTPFPFSPSDFGYLQYYRIPSNFAKLDPGLAPTASRIYNINPRFAFHIYQDGTYEVTVRIKNVTRDPI
jgi:hypothetical protein